MEIGIRQRVKRQSEGFLLASESSPISRHFLYYPHYMSFILGKIYLSLLEDPMRHSQDRRL
jgi:hypothetical protein